MSIRYIICDKQQAGFFTRLAAAWGWPAATLCFICSAKELQRGLQEPNDDAVVILLDAVITWQSFSSQFYGFDILLEIRSRYRSRLPVCLFSYMDRVFFEALAKTELKYRMLYGVGCHYLHFPVKNPQGLAECLASVPQLSEAALHDVITMLGNLKGVVIDQFNHELRFSGETNIAAIFSKLKPYFSDAQQQAIGLGQYEEQLALALIEKDKRSFYDRKELLLKACSLYLTQTISEDSLATANKPAVLLLDDREAELTAIQSLLSPYFTVLATTQGAEAMALLKEDRSNRILAIISDWRLYQTESLDYWQDLQGYDILAYAARTGVRALFALTSQADYVVHQIRNILGIRFSMFKKDLLRSPEQWHLFVSVLRDACTQTSELIAGIPAGAGWTRADKGKRSLHEQYLEARNGPGWLDYEARISERADEIWQYYSAYLDRQNDDSLQDFSEYFGITLKNNLEGTLIARRIVTGLYLNQGKIYQNINGSNYPRIDVYSVFKNRFYEDFLEEAEQQDPNDLNGKSLEEYTIDKMVSASSGLLNSSLCLDMDRLPSLTTLLPEERAWTKKRGFKLSMEYTTGDDEPEPARSLKTGLAQEQEPSIMELNRLTRDLDTYLGDPDEELSDGLDA